MKLELMEYYIDGMNDNAFAFLAERLQPLFVYTKKDDIRRCDVKELIYDNMSNIRITEWKDKEEKDCYFETLKEYVNLFKYSTDVRLSNKAAMALDNIKNPANGTPLSDLAEVFCIVACEVFKNMDNSIEVDIPTIFVSKENLINIIDFFNEKKLNPEFGYGFSILRPSEAPYQGRKRAYMKRFVWMYSLLILITLLQNRGEFEES